MSDRSDTRAPSPSLTRATCTDAVPAGCAGSSQRSSADDTKLLLDAAASCAPEDAADTAQRAPTRKPEPDT